MARKNKSVLVPLRQPIRSNFTLDYSFLEVWLEVASYVFPGEDLPFQWGAQVFGTAPDLGIVSVTLQLIDAAGNLDENGILYQFELTKAESAQVVTQPGFSSDVIHIDDMPDDVATRFYRVGNYTLCLIVSGSGPDGGPYRSECVTVGVVLYPLDDRLWSWNIPATSVAWKQNYTVTGDLTDITTAAMTCSVALLETNLTDITVGETQIATDVVSAPIASGQQVAVAFNGLVLNKQWQWNLPVVFLPSGPTAETFSYRVRLDITDQYLNGYPPFFTMPATVGVTVSTVKIAADVTAVAAETTALYLLAVAAAVALIPVAGWVTAAGLLGAAGVAEGIAGGAGAYANDPPVPDARYRLPVPVRIPQLPANTEPTPLTKLVVLVGALVTYLTALAETDNRIAGAVASNDWRSLRLQVRHFSTLQKPLSRIGKEIGTNAREAVEWVHGSEERLTAARLDEAVHQLGADPGLRTKLRKMYADGGGTIEGFQQLVEATADPRFSGGLLRPANVVSALSRAATDLATNAALLKPSLPARMSNKARVVLRRRGR